MASPGQVPGHIRLFACTEDSALGHAALAYARSLLRIAPVRLVTFSGTLEGPWRPYGELLGTAMHGTGVTCVAVDPSRWVWSMEIPMPEQDGGVAAIVAADDLGHVGAHTVLKRSAEIYSSGGTRHVLFAIATPRDGRQLAAAEKYEEIVVPGEHYADWWHKVSSRRVHVVPAQPDVTEHGKIRELVIGREGRAC
jgi:hypothetical protein